MKNKKIQFYYYIDFTRFSIGFNIGKPHKITGYKLYIGIDIGFISI